MGVVLATSNASGGMGSDVRGQGGAMSVSLVDSSDVRGRRGHRCGSGGQQWVNVSYGMCRVFLVGETFV